MLTPLEIASGARHGRTPVGECPKKVKRRDAEDEAAASGVADVQGSCGSRSMTEMTRSRPHQADDDEQRHVGYEEICGDRKEPAGLADPA
jgi:hypothetical protein